MSRCSTHDSLRIQHKFVWICDMSLPIDKILWAVASLKFWSPL